MNYSGKQAPSTFTWVWINRISMFPKQKDHSWVFLLSKTNCIYNAISMSWRLQMTVDTVILIVHFITVNTICFLGVQWPTDSLFEHVHRRNEQSHLSCFPLVLCLLLCSRVPPLCWEPSEIPSLRLDWVRIWPLWLEFCGANFYIPDVFSLTCSPPHPSPLQTLIEPVSVLDSDLWFGHCDQLCFALLVPWPWQLIGCLIIIIPSM